MTANAAPIFILSPRVAAARIATANVNRDGTGTVGSLCVAGANGTRIDRIIITATATTTAGMIRFFSFDGTNYRAIKEVAVSAVTPSATVPAFNSEWVRPNTDTPPMPLLWLPPGYTLFAATNNAESFDVVAFGGDY